MYVYLCVCLGMCVQVGNGKRVVTVNPGEVAYGQVNRVRFRTQDETGVVSCRIHQDPIIY